MFGGIDSIHIERGEDFLALLDKAWATVLDNAKQYIFLTKQINKLLFYRKMKDIQLFIVENFRRLTFFIIYFMLNMLHFYILLIYSSSRESQGLKINNK